MTMLIKHAGKPLVQQSIQITKSRIAELEHRCDTKQFQEEIKEERERLATLNRVMLRAENEPNRVFNG